MPLVPPPPPLPSPGSAAYVHVLTVMFAVLSKLLAYGMYSRTKMPEVARIMLDCTSADEC